MKQLLVETAITSDTAHTGKQLTQQDSADTAGIHTAEITNKEDTEPDTEHSQRTQRTLLTQTDTVGTADSIDTADTEGPIGKDDTAESRLDRHKVDTVGTSDMARTAELTQYTKQKTDSRHSR